MVVAHSLLGLFDEQLLGEVFLHLCVWDECRKQPLGEI